MSLPNTCDTGKDNRIIHFGKIVDAYVIED